MWPMSRPRKTSPCSWPSRIAPIRALMPYCMTIARATVVAFSMSLAAPVVGSWKTSSSATRPPSMYASWSSISLRVVEYLSSSGSTIVYPRARPRGRIVILCTGSVLLSAAATRACPPSWYAVIFFSFSFISRVRFCGPATTRSIASSSAALPMSLAPPRAVSSAASLRTFARSAPVKPGVRLATANRSMSPASGLPLACTVRMSSRPLQVGPLDRDLPVEAARPQQRRVEDVGAVRRGDEDDAALDVEAVHLDQQLVQRLLALVVAAAETRAAVPADGVDLVDEDDRGRVRLGLLEQVAHAGGADADEHLDEVRAGDRVERHAGLAGDRAGQQRLAGAGRAVQQHALGDLRADGLELGRLLQELLDLLELLDRLVDAGDVGERGLRHVLGHELGARLAEAHDPRAAALHAVHQEEEQDDDDRDRQQGDQQGQPDALLRDLVVERHGLGAEQVRR